MVVGKDDYIICDELHSLIAFQHYSRRPNYHSIALGGLRSAVNNDRTTVIALTATPSKVKDEFNAPYFELAMDQDELIQYDTRQIIPFANLEFILSSLDPADTGIIYTARITQMLALESSAREMGLSPVAIWSIRNQDHPMEEEQLSARESILKNYTIPEQYNLLIINSSSETSLKIKSPVDYVIVNSENPDTQLQVRGRVNSDLERLYLRDNRMEDIELPTEFLGVRLFTSDKDRLCEYLNRRNHYNRQYRWPTVKTLLLDSDYTLSEGRYNNLRYVVITKNE